MSENKKLKQAKLVFQTLCEMLDDADWRYEKNEEKLLISCSARGEDLPIDLKIKIGVEEQLIALLSPMPYDIPEKRRNAIAVAVSQANHLLVDGSFDYNYLKGKIFFRMTQSYWDSLIGKELFEYMVMTSCYIVDDFNDKFLMIAKSEMSYEEILKFIG